MGCHPTNILKLDMPKMDTCYLPSYSGMYVEEAFMYLTKKEIEFDCLVEHHPAL